MAELSTEVVHDRLRADILRGAFDPREPISQVQLAKRLGVSRTPLREALRMLQREGLIDSEPNRRVRVTALTVGDLEQLYAARIMIDSLRTRLVVPRLTSDDLAELERRLQAMAGERDLDAWDVHHRVFHDLLKRRVGERLDRIAQELFDHTERYRRVYLAEPRAWLAAAREHTAIFEACRGGDAAAASHHVARHLGTTALTIIAMAEPERDPVPVREALRMVTGERS
jgi:DNA-binding GntR family transcriptional regulator